MSKLFSLVRRIRLAKIARLALVAVLSGPALAGQGEYRLGPQDKLDIRVYDVRAGSGEAHQWDALNGEFLIGATGSVSLPLLGEVPAGNGTTAELATAIASRLRAKIGLAQLPDASVQVIKYRPFYIMGLVARPGEFDYRPGLTVLQAVSIAGGLTRMSDGQLLGYERDALVERGDLRLLASERLALMVRQARLDAEIADASAITLSSEVKGRLTDPEVARAVREEQLLFNSRRDGLGSQVEAIRQARALLVQELTTLAAKDATLSRQLDMTKKELSQVNDLVSKGLAVVTRQLAAEQSAAAFESSRLDIQLATLRAQQDISKADRDELDLRTERRNQALTEATEVRAKLVAAGEKIATAQGLAHQSEVSAPLALLDGGGDRPLMYLLTRRGASGPETYALSEDEEVEPGDVLRVELPDRGGAIGGGHSDYDSSPKHATDTSANTQLGQ